MSKHAGPVKDMPDTGRMEEVVEVLSYLSDHHPFPFMHLAHLELPAPFINGYELIESALVGFSI
jgi:hypothetical protein